MAGSIAGASAAVEVGDTLVVQPGQYSPDGRWWWDGYRWQPVSPLRPAGPADMFWFFRDPNWAGPFFLSGLILLLPIVGSANLLGWYMTARDHLRSGWPVLPRANLDYLGRGIRLWVASLVYGLYALVPVALIGMAVGIMVVVTNFAWGFVDWMILAVVLFLVWIAAEIPVAFTAAAWLDLADTVGIGAALNPFRAWRVACADARNSWRVFGAFALGTVVLGMVGFLLNFVPFGGLLLVIVMPGPYLMAAPAQAEFRGLSAVQSG
jgi:Protein of unknown function (DUF4013)